MSDLVVSFHWWIYRTVRRAAQFVGLPVPPWLTDDVREDLRAVLASAYEQMLSQGKPFFDRIKK